MHRRLLLRRSDIELYPSESFIIGRFSSVKTSKRGAAFSLMLRRTYDSLQPVSYELHDACTQLVSDTCTRMIVRIVPFGFLLVSQVARYTSMPVPFGMWPIIAVVPMALYSTRRTRGLTGHLTEVRAVVWWV